MKKSERQTREIERATQTRKHERQEDAMASFFAECRVVMTPEHWIKYYSEANATAGETFHIFDHMIFALAETQIIISPQLRKRIDAVLDACEIERSRIRGLNRLNYDPYWKAKYGYAENDT